MQNLNRSFSTTLFPSLSSWATILAIFLLLGFVREAALGQTQVAAESILKKMDREETVEISDAVITGDLDFTKLEKKYKGGSYGVRSGMVKQFYGKLKAPLVLKNCTLKGDIITRRDEKTPGVLKEYFTAFDAKVVFENCRFDGTVTFEQVTFYEDVVIKNCVFEEKTVFEKVNFTKAPIISDNDFKGRMVNEKTNWPAKTELALTPPTEDENVVEITLKNTSLATIYFKFGNKTWNVMPLGSSGVTTRIGEQFFLVKDGKKDRLLFSASEDMDGKTLVVNKL